MSCRNLFLMAAFAAVLVVSSAPAQADNTTILYSMNEDQTYSVTAIYLVDPKEALEAYSRSAGFGGGASSPTYALHEDETGTLVGSAEGYQEFLQANYTQIGMDRSNQACDDTVIVAWTITCPAPATCPSPPGICESVIWATWTVTCLNDPPCPVVGKTSCDPFAGRIDTVTFAGSPCLCDGGVPDTCQDMGLIPTSFTATGPVCECVEPPKEHIYCCGNLNPVPYGTPDPIQPGADVVLTAGLPAWLELSKGGVVEQVGLLSSTINVSIGPDIGGVSQITVTGGGGQFDAYVFDGEPVGVSDYIVEKGSGSINWGTREVNAQVIVLVSATGFADIQARATGVGQLALDNLSIDLLPGASACEISIIPTLSGWGLIVLTLVLLTAGALVIRRRRALAA